jgi:ComF family protein
MAASYDGAVRQLVRQYKFGRVRAAYRPLAMGMIDTLPYLQDVVVVPIPTAPVRIRQRGYDQAALLAREIAHTQGWQYATPLRRRHSQRQVGASRVLRMRQAQEAFELVEPDSVRGKHVLLVDDVTTSGATLLAAAQLLVRASAAQINAVVAAKHTIE